MRIYIFILCLLILSCQTKSKQDKVVEPNQETEAASTNESESNYYSFKGNINSNIPIFVHFTNHEKVSIGEITYLNTKNKTAIPILAIRNEDDNYRFLEFSKSGNITGIINGQIQSGNFEGKWFSPTTRKNFSMHMTSFDSLVIEPKIEFNPEGIYGEYRYAFGKEGRQGTMNISDLGNQEVLFKIFSMTQAPGRNMAQLNHTKADLKANRLIHTFENYPQCDFEMLFYHRFVLIQYLEGPCQGYFGHNATLEGIYWKVH